MILTSVALSSSSRPGPHLSTMITSSSTLTATAQLQVADCLEKSRLDVIKQYIYIRVIQNKQNEKCIAPQGLFLYLNYYKNKSKKLGRSDNI